MPVGPVGDIVGGNFFETKKRKGEYDAVFEDRTRKRQERSASY